MTRLVLLVGAVVLLVGIGSAVAKTSSFRTPSKNSYCLYSSSGGPGPVIRCDVLSLNDVGFLLDRRHKAQRVKVTDSVVSPRARALRYGSKRRHGLFNCVSRTTGLTCRSRRSRHGFKLSRARQRVF